MGSPSPSVLAVENAVFKLSQSIVSQEVVFKSRFSKNTQKVDWFVDEVLQNTGLLDEEIYWSPEVGRHVLRVVAYDENNSRNEKIVNFEVIE